MSDTEREAEHGLAEEKGVMTNSMDDLENNSELLAKVSEGLGILDEVTIKEPEPEAKEPEAKEPEAKEPEAKEPEAKEPEDGLPEEIPYNYVRAAVRLGWKEEDIEKLAASDPDMAFATMRNIFESVNKLSDRYSEFGRKTKEQTAQTEQTSQTTQTEQDTTTKKPFVDIEKIREQYGNDPMIDAVIKPMSDALEELRTEVSASKQVMPNPAQQQQRSYYPEELTRELDAFFGSEPLLKHYGDFYGSSNVQDDLTLGQTKQRHSVIEKADQIIAGAMAQGIDMSVGEALENAHLLISEPVRRAAIREEIKATAKQRGKGISLRPSKTTTNATEQNKPRTEAELEQKVAERLGALDI